MGITSRMMMGRKHASPSKPAASPKHIVLTLFKYRRSYCREVILQSGSPTVSLLLAKSAAGTLLFRRISRVRKRRLNLLDVALEAVPSTDNILGIYGVVLPGSLKSSPQRFAQFSCAAFSLIYRYSPTREHRGAIGSNRTRRTKKRK